MSSRTAAGALCAVLMVLGAGSARAEDQPPEPPGLHDRGARRHDGMMLRLAFGAGLASAAQGDVTYGGGTPTGELELRGEAEHSGPGLTFSIDLGAAPADNVVVLLRLAAIGFWEAEMRIDGTEVATTRDDVRAFLVAPGATYYLMPANVYAAAAVGVSWIDVDNPWLAARDNGATGLGIGLNLDAGKEWWIGDQVGMGLGGRFWYTRVASDGAQRFMGFAVLASCTFQ